MVSEGQCFHELLLMDALSDFGFRHIPNRPVNFKAANLLLQHVHNFLLNQSLGKKKSCLFLTKWRQTRYHVRGSELRKMEQWYIQWFNATSFAYYIGVICWDLFWCRIKFKNGRGRYTIHFSNIREHILTRLEFKKYWFQLCYLRS